ncbi:MAG: hypothetical protein QXJ62_06545 [Nitrososphaeria archaeon]
MGGGTASKQKIGYGPVSQAGYVIQKIGRVVIRGIAENIILSIATSLFPFYAGFIFKGYTLYKLGKDVAAISKDYESTRGSPGSKIVKIAAKEGFKAGISELTAGLDNIVREKIEQGVHTTSDELSQCGFFRGLTQQMGIKSEYADDLRYFFNNTTVRVIQDFYSGVKNEITDYISERVIE